MVLLIRPLNCGLFFIIHRLVPFHSIADPIDGFNSPSSIDCWLQFLTAMLSHLLLVLCIVGFSRSINSSPGFGNGGGDDGKVLIVGEELWKQTIPLQLGSRVYELQGLKSHTWYEVKISYPASIPASFTIQLKKDDSDPGMNRVARRLLNTEKLIFKTDVILDSNQSKLCVLVRVEPEGVVAIPNVEERKDITFNIGSKFTLHFANATSITILIF
ncbi:hypothetical protein D5086_013747 [Populus alba]|uniref:Uncharacterized protein n=1 Tax=Populus alba TaxID=43335 RepID=A0ACC4C7F7_POPAL